MMMMMMVVSLSEQAKQPLSLPLPPKVFFSPFFHPSPCSFCWLFFHHLSDTSVISALSLFGILFPHLLICVIPSLSASLLLYFCPPTSPQTPLWHWYCEHTVVMWWCGLIIYNSTCGNVLCKVLLWTQVGFHPFGSLCPYFCQLCPLSFFFLQLVVNQKTLNVGKKILSG